MRRGARGGLLDVRDGGLEGGAVLHGDLAPEQVERLDAVGALINQRDADIADELLGPPLGRVAGTAIDLLRADCGFEAFIR